MSPDELLRLCDDFAVLNIHVCPKRTESFQVLVDRSASDVTSARKSHFRPFILSEKSSQKIIRCTDLLDIVVFHIIVSDSASVDLDRMTVNPVYFRADSGNGIQ